MKHPPLHDQMESHLINAEVFDEMRPILAENRRLRKVLTSLIQAVKVYQFSPNGSVDQTHAARDMDDAMDAASATLKGLA